MHTNKEYKKKIKELSLVAKDWMDNKTPEEGLELASRMDPVDAYILGRIIGGVLQAEKDVEEFMHAVSEVCQMREKSETRIQNDFSLN